MVVLPEGGNDIYTAVKKWVTYLFAFCVSPYLSFFSFGDVSVSAILFVSSSLFL